MAFDYQGSGWVQGGIVRGGLHGLVTSRLGQSIASGELAEGAQIVPEDLGRELGVSRTVVREALRVLIEKGMVQATPRLGTRVTNIDQWSLLDPDVIKWRVNGPQRDEQLRELMSLRIGIEPLAAHGAAEHAVSDDVDFLRSCCSDMERAAKEGDLVAFTSADVAFHSRILAASGNLIYRQFVHPIEAVLTARKDLDMLPPHVDSMVLAHHRSIVDSISEHDGERAESLTREMIDTARGEISEKIAGPPSSAGMNDA